MEYQYEPLPIIEESDDIHIRLVILPPGPRTGPITCSIFVTRLSEAPEFETLSYCWGSTQNDGTIYITSKDEPQASPPGFALRVPGSVIPFLYRTRSRAVPGQATFWIDSICINQQDPEEKNVQVPKMREIYSNAKNTISWLGPEGAWSADAFKYAAKLSKLYRNNVKKLEDEGVVLQDLPEKIINNVKLGDPGLAAMVNLTERPYFERAWIVQEVVVSKVVWLICGDAVISWEELFEAYMYLVLVTPWVWEFYPSQRMLFLFNLKFSEIDWKAEIRIPWWKTLLRHRIYKSGDPRDKIFAYYGLACKQDLQELCIQPDYKNTTMESLFAQLAIRSLELGQSEIFHVPRIVVGSEQEGSTDFAKAVLPSWVPDWRWTRGTPDALIDGESTGTVYHATNNSVFRVDFGALLEAAQRSVQSKSIDQPSHIRINGFTVARITHLTATWDFQAPVGDNTLLSEAHVLRYNHIRFLNWETVMRPSQSSPTNSYFPTGESQMTAFYETLMAGTSVFPQAHKLAAAAAFERRQRALRVIHTLHLHHTLIIYCFVVLVERFLRRFGYKNSEIKFRMLMGKMLNRRGARLLGETPSKTEYLGLVPSLCELGDHLVLVEGVKMPLILRRKGHAIVQPDDIQGVNKTVETWEFIGDCYIHGAMKGEVWEQRKHDEREAYWIS